MPKISIKQFSTNNQLIEENQRLLKDLQNCRKRTEFLENYRKVLNQFNRNCVCDQNKVTTYLFRSLERQYRLVAINDRNQRRHKKSGKTIKTNKTDDKNICENRKSVEVSEPLEPISDNICDKQNIENTVLVFNKQNNVILRKTFDTIDTNNETIIRKYVLKTAEEVNKSCDQFNHIHNNTNNRQLNEFTFDPREVPKNSSESCLNSRQSPKVCVTSQQSTEDDSDLTLPSLQNLIFSFNANYVQELAAQVVPKIGEQETIAVPDSNTEAIETVVKIIDQTSSQTIPEQRSDLLNVFPVKSSHRFTKLLENVRTGRLETFNDPNNEQICVFLKKFITTDGKSVSKIYYKCNQYLCGFETQSQSYIERHINRHKTSNSLLRKTQINYKMFSNLLSELKNRKIDSFIDPDYDLVLVTLSREEPDGCSAAQTVPKLLYKCLHPNCLFETNGKYYVRSHVLRHNKLKSFSCSKCSEKFVSKVNFVEHEMSVHNIHKRNLFVCDYTDCNYKTTVRQAMDCHKIKHKIEKTFKCEKTGCDLYFKSINHMKSHMKRIHITKTVVCEWPGCEARFKNKYEAQQHLLVHTGEKITVRKIRDILKEGNYISTVDKSNKLFSVIRQQIIRESDGQMEIGSKLGYKCNFNDCRFVCITPHMISEHTSSHSLGKIYECDLCHKLYGLRNHLNNHKKLIHNIGNKYPVLNCTFPQCLYSTTNPYCLKQHERTHQKETPFVCTENGCQKRFKTNISLKQHINNTHTKVNLLACDWPGCKSVFKTKTYLKHHLKWHSEPKQVFNCEVCQKSFNFKTSLTKHIKSQHIIC